MTGLVLGAVTHGAGDDPREYTFPADTANITKFNVDDLIPAAAQEGSIGRVLMMARADPYAPAYIIATERDTYWSWPRSEYWIEELANDHSQTVISLALNCDGDTVLIQVVQDGVACHTSSHNCSDVHPVFGG